MQGEREGDISSSPNGWLAVCNRLSPSFPRQNQSAACSRPSHSSQRED